MSEWMEWRITKKETNHTVLSEDFNILTREERTDEAEVDLHKPEKNM